MEKYVILGGSKLEGEGEISGAKNSAVALIAASIMVKGECLIENVPRVTDIYVLTDILRQLGGEAEFLEDKTLRIDCTNLSKFESP